ncbi:hypothetical protein GGQ92_002912 [Gracilibacillus halotolerans]|uniref:DUF3048 domain-containing protein n=1 Tax=Gracilibacillus halotolerans TaxID=74386 RepID=A0A841RMQ4_9BACI|nr:DUF3048 domain-containing protein [Gracilibacillus halotolerans]MBB6514091.1 hypothetical protein [Gracilibacillus halotolerans]
MKAQWKIFLALILCILLIACSKEEEESTPKQKVDTDPIAEEPVVEPEMFVYPYTGLETADEPTNRAISVMVNNHPKARPQTGLSQADIVFEILAEGNITRFLAIFHSDIPEKVGPVRSARPYYFNLANNYDALYVYHGAANFIEDMIQSGETDGLNGMYYDNDKVLFERSSDRVAPHNSYAIFDGIATRAEEKNYELEAVHEPLLFADEEVTGESAVDVTLPYSNYQVRYEYDANKDAYHRFSDGAQTVEYTDSTPIELANVLILETNHQVIDNAGRREIDLTSGGEALLLQRGKVQNVQWEQIDGRIIPTKDGKPVPFIPGKTWVNVIPTSPGISGVSISEISE